MALILLLVQAKLWLLGSAGDPRRRGEERGDRIAEEEEEEKSERGGRGRRKKAYFDFGWSFAHFGEHQREQNLNHPYV